MKNGKSSKHHRLPRCRNGSNDKKNISVVSQKAHRAYHLLFNHLPPDKVALLLNNIWIDQDWELIAIKRRT